MNIEPVGKGQSFTGFQIRRDLILIEISLILIVYQNHDDISLLYCLLHCKHLKAVFNPGIPRFTRAQTQYYLNPAVSQILRMGVSLTAIPDHRHCFTV